MAIGGHPLGGGGNPLDGLDIQQFGVIGTIASIIWRFFAGQLKEAKDAHATTKKELEDKVTKLEARLERLETDRDQWKDKAMERGDRSQPPPTPTAPRPPTGGIG